MTDEFDITVESGRLHAQRFGARSASRLVVGVPGLAGTMKNFDFIGERLAGDHLQLVALDLRGRGRSETTPPGTYGWERHALDVLAVVSALGHERFAVIGQSMGGSVAMKVAELDGARLDAVVLIDVAGRVDRGVGAVIAGVIERLGRIYPSVDDYVAAVRADGLIDPWNEHWERAYRYDAHEVDSGVRSRANPDAVMEDRAYTSTQHPYDRWKHLTMPTLLVRATRELRPGAGFVVPADDRDLFQSQVPGATIVEVDANHLTTATNATTTDAISRFLSSLS